MYYLILIPTRETKQFFDYLLILERERRKERERERHQFVVPLVFAFIG